MSGRMVEGARGGTTGDRLKVNARPRNLSPAIRLKSDVKDDFADIRVDAKGEAKEQARVALREKNKTEWVVKLRTVGNVNMRSGATFTIEGFGVFDGKYIAEKVVHSLGNDGYTNDIDGRRVLEGY